MGHDNNRSAEQKAATPILHKLWNKIVSFFEPEEVEVTFQEDKGKVVSYTYKVVDEKQVA